MYNYIYEYYYVIIDNTNLWRLLEHQQQQMQQQVIRKTKKITTNMTIITMNTIAGTILEKRGRGERGRISKLNYITTKILFKQFNSLKVITQRMNTFLTLPYYKVIEFGCYGNVG